MEVEEEHQYLSLLLLLLFFLLLPLDSSDIRLFTVCRSWTLISSSSRLPPPPSCPQSHLLVCSAALPCLTVCSVCYYSLSLAAVVSSLLLLCRLFYILLFPSSFLFLISDSFSIGNLSLFSFQSWFAALLHAPFLFFPILVRYLSFMFHSTTSYSCLVLYSSTFFVSPTSRIQLSILL